MCYQVNINHLIFVFVSIHTNIDTLFSILFEWKTNKQCIEFYATPVDPHQSKTKNHPEITRFNINVESFINDTPIEQEPFVHDGQQETWSIRYELIETPGTMDQLSKLEDRFMLPEKQNEFMINRLKKLLKF